MLKANKEQVFLKICSLKIRIDSVNKILQTKNKLNPLGASDALIWKPVNWFAVQINWLVSIPGQHWQLMG